MRPQIEQRRTWMIAIALAIAGCSATPIDETSRSQATTVCGGGNVVHGMDVSSYEASIDWPTAKASGIDFAFIRVSDGLGFRDPKFDAYWAGAGSAGVIRGAYQFFRPAQDPIAQADLLLAATGPHQDGDLPPTLDVETTGGLPPDAVAASVRAWIDHVTAAIGRPPIVYAGYYSWQDDTGSANLTASPLWHAQYTSAPCPNIPTPWTSWSFWQYSSTGSVPSVTGELTDLDVFDGTLAELRSFADHPPAACGTIGAQGGEIDDGDPCFSAGGPAATLRQVTGAGERDGLRWTHATAAARAGNFGLWSLEFAEAGSYRVEAYTAAGYAQSHQARYVVRAAGTDQAIAIDQAAVDGWQSLGDLGFAAGGAQFVQLDDDTGEGGGSVQLVFDAIRFTRLDGPSLPPPPPDAQATSPDDGGCATRGGAGLGTALSVLLAITVRRRRVRR